MWGTFEQVNIKTMYLYIIRLKQLLHLTVRDTAAQHYLLSTR